jgi:hypothetical protein
VTTRVPFDKTPIRLESEGQNETPFIIRRVSGQIAPLIVFQDELGREIGRWYADDTTTRTRTFRVDDYLPANHVYGTDDALAGVNSAVAAAVASGNGQVCFDAREYYLSGRINGANKVRFSGWGENTGLNFADLVDYSFLWTNAFFTAGTSSLLTSDGLENSRVVAVASGAAFAVGDWVLVSNALVGTAAPHGAFTSRVAGKSGNTIYLEDTLPQTYTVAATSRLYKAPTPLWTGCALEDMVIRVHNKAYDTFAALKEVHVRADMCADLKIKDVRFEGARQASVLVSGYCRGAKIDDCEHYQIAGSVLECNAVCVDSATNTHISRNRMDRCGGGITAQRGPRTSATENKIHGTVRTQATAQASTDWSSRGIKLLWGSHHSQAKTNELCDIVLDALHVIDSSWCTLEGNDCYRIGDEATQQVAIVVDNDVGAGSPVVGTRVVTNRVVWCAAAFVSVGAYCPHTQVNDNHLYQALQWPGFAGGGSAVGFNADDCQFNGNHVYDWGLAGTFATGVGINIGVLRFQCVGNHFRGATTGYAIDTGPPAHAPSVSDASVVAANQTGGMNIRTHANDTVGNNK